MGNTVPALRKKIIAHSFRTRKNNMPLLWLRGEKMTEIHKAQRIGVFVDVQNLYYSARFVYNAHVNFKTILQDAVKGRTLVRALAYVIKTEDISKEKFFDALEHIGFEVHAKDLQIFYGGAKKGDWDIGIAMDAIELAPRLDTIVIVSGDGDFVPLVEHLKRALGCRVEAVAFGKSASAKLREAVDDFTDLDKDTRKYLIKPAKKMPVNKEVDTHTMGAENGNK
jgi:uncharacterized LabA/DUF88 family protein